MAKVIFVRHNKEGSFTEFSLSNKPELLFKCDTEDFYRTILRDTETMKSDYYVHICTRKTKNRPYLRTAFVDNKDGRVKHLHFHREIMQAGNYCASKSIVDHIDRDTLDCRKSNLRIVGAKESNRNRSSIDGGWGERTHMGLSYCQVKGRGIYQCYCKQKYVGSSATIKGMEKKIEEFKKREELQQV